MFAVGDIVAVKNRRDLKAYGKIAKIENGNAEVHFSLPRQPLECEGCGGPSMGLSVDGGTGEVVCMRSGCGYEHGFRKYTETIPIDNLTNITIRRRDEKRNRAIADFKCAIEKAASSGLITDNDRTQLLEKLSS